MMQRNKWKSSFGSMLDELKLPGPWKWLECIDTLHNVSIHLAQKPCLHRYNEHCIDTVINVSILWTIVSILWTPISIHVDMYRYIPLQNACFGPGMVQYRYMRSGIDTEAYVSIHLHVVSIQMGIFQIFAALEHCIDTWEPCINTFK